MQAFCFLCILWQYTISTAMYCKDHKGKSKGSSIGQDQELRMNNICIGKKIASLFSMYCTGETLVVFFNEKSVHYMLSNMANG